MRAVAGRELGTALALSSGTSRNPSPRVAPRARGTGFVGRTNGVSHEAALFSGRRVTRIAERVRAPKYREHAMTHWPDVERAVRAGDRVGALKLYRQRTGAALSEAKRAVEDLERELGASEVPIVGDLDEVFASLEASSPEPRERFHPHAVRRARDLAWRAIELADQHRDGRLTEQLALERLASEHPGFSAATYRLAFGRGLRDTR